MRRLGYTLTWQTSCLLSGGCGKKDLFGHTNGRGDFVLFDDLGWPWPIHECYVRRFDLGPSAVDPNALVINVGRSERVEVPDPDTLTNDWDQVEEVIADMDDHRKKVSIIGTITNIERGYLSRVIGHSSISREQQQEIKQRFELRKDHVVVTTGGGEEYGFFVDLRQTPSVKEYGTVAAEMQAVLLLNKPVFLSSNLRIFRFDEKTR